MKFCPNCGTSVEEGAKFCLNCGASLTEKSTPVVEEATHQATDATPAVTSPKTSNLNDSGTIWWGVLGFCIPLVGIILRLVWNTSSPNNARSAGYGAGVGFAWAIIFWITTAIATALGAA